MYDPAIGRFPSVYPIADQFPHISPFNYAENEPIGNIDLHGLQKYSVKNGEIVGTFNEVTVTAKAPWWYNNYKGYIAQGQFSDAMAYRRYARIGGLGPTVSAQTNNGEYPRLSGMKAWSPDAGGGTADWQNGIGGDLQRGIGLLIGVPLAVGPVGTVGSSLYLDVLLEFGSNSLFKGEFKADGADILLNGTPLSTKYKILFGGLIDIDTDGTVKTVGGLFGSTSKNPIEASLEMAIGTVFNSEAFLGRMSSQLHIGGDNFITQGLSSGLEKSIDSGFRNLRYSAFIEKYKGIFSDKSGAKAEAVEGIIKNATGM